MSPGFLKAAALAEVDIVLRDIMGKAFGVPADSTIQPRRDASCLTAQQIG